MACKISDKEIYMEGINIAMKDKVEELKKIDGQIDALYKQREDLLKILPDLVIYPNEDTTWTRLIKTDNAKALAQGETIWKRSPVTQFSTDLKELKNPPKELKG